MIKQIRIFYFMMVGILFFASCTNPSIENYSPEQAKEKVEKMGYNFSQTEFLRNKVLDDKQLVNLFLKAGISPNTTDPDGNISALCKAARRGKTETVKLLINFNADLDSQCDIYHFTPLRIASERGFADIVRALINAGADVNLRDTNEGMTALGIVNFYMKHDNLRKPNHEEIRRFLVDSGGIE